MPQAESQEAQSQEDSAAPPCCNTENPALALLQEELRRLRLKAGQPSFRAIAKDTGWSHSTIARAFTGDNTPKWDLLEALITHLRADPERIRALWIASMDPKPRPAEQLVPSHAKHSAAPFPAITAAASICALLVVVVLRDLAPNATHRNELITGVAQLLFVAVAGFLWWRVFLAQKGKENLAVALCLSGWVLAAIWGVFEASPARLPRTLPPLANLVVTFLPSVCFIVLSTASLQRPQRKPAIITMSAAAPICFALFAFIVSRSSALSLGAQIGYAAFSTAYLAALFLTARIALLKRNWTWTLALSGITTMVVTHLMIVSFLTTRPDQSIPIGAAAGLLVCPLILIVAARCAAIEAAAATDPRAAAPEPAAPR